MLSLLRSVFNHHCSHQFLWPQRRSEGGHYQICIRCGDQYVYDWETMARAERITASVPSRTLAPQPSARVPRTQRFTVRKPGTSLEMILEMPQEITGQPQRIVLCRGEIVRSVLWESGIALVGVAISNYSFGARDRDRQISEGQVCLLPKPG